MGAHTPSVLYGQLPKLLLTQARGGVHPPPCKVLMPLPESSSTRHLTRGLDFHLTWTFARSATLMGLQLEENENEAMEGRAWVQQTPDTAHMLPRQIQ